MCLSIFHKQDKLGVSVFLTLFLICFFLFSQSALSQVREIQIVNQTGAPIMQVYIASPEEDDWGNNEINSPIQNNSKYKIKDLNKQSCVFDIRVIITDDGIEYDIEYFDIDFCYDRVLIVE